MEIFLKIRIENHVKKGSYSISKRLVLYESMEKKFERVESYYKYQGSLSKEKFVDGECSVLGRFFELVICSVQQIQRFPC